MRPEGTSQDGKLIVEGSYILPESNSLEVMEFGGTATLFLLADDATVIGVADDPLIPFVIGGTVLIAAGVEVYDTFFADEKDNTIPYAIELDIAKKEPNFTPIYRWGSGTGMNLTPRESDWNGLSYSLVEPAGGKYTVTYMEIVNSTGVLKAINDLGDHVSVTPLAWPAETGTLEEWSASRANANTNPHYLTQILQEISTKEKK